MAKFWDNLKYHEDTVEKEKLTKEDITFLKDLQKELNTEDTVGTASPRFWVIKQPERIYHVDKDEAEHYMFIEKDSHSELTLEDLKEKLEYLYDENLKDIKIENNEAFVVSSTCSNKTCITAPKLKNHGDWNACLPNKVFLSVEKK